MKFYTNVQTHKDKILLRGYENNKRVVKEIKYKPYLFVKTNSTENTKYKNLEDQPVHKLDFDSIWEAREYTQKYQDVQGFKLYGLTNYEYVYINDTYRGDIQYDVDLLSIVSLDIETASEGGFSTPQDANQEVTAITLRKRNKIFTLGCKPFIVKDKRVKYVHCQDEIDLLTRFIELWKLLDIDIVTGWNIDQYDITYLVNRIKKLIGEFAAKKLSPWELLKERTITILNKEVVFYELVGISVVDYLQLYKKFSFKTQESYKLGDICQQEIGEGKIDYSEYDGIHQLYKLNYQKYIEYNIQDTDLIFKLDDKVKLIEQLLAIAYNSKVNFNDAFTTVRLWDVVIHNHLIEQNYVVPFKQIADKDFSIEGAYVKDPKVGMYNWVCSFDLTSLYPMLMWMYNISPNTFVSKYEQQPPIDKIVTGAYNDDPTIQKYFSKNYTITANGVVWRKDRRGFLPELVEKIFERRVHYKNKMLEAKKEKETNPSKDVEKRITQAHNMQLALKIVMNSLYGAVGNAGFRFFNPDMAEAITKSGQLSVKWIEYHINKYLNNLLKTEGVDYVIAVDTDSTYITLDKLVYQTFEDISDIPKVVSFLDKFCKETMQPFIAESYKNFATYVNAYAQKMDMKREAIGDKGIWTGKKHYILNVYDMEGVRYNEPQLKIMGLEAIKSSTPQSCREKIKQAIRLIMSKDEIALQKFIEQFKKEFFQMKFDDIAFPRGCNNLEKYSDRISIYGPKTPIHVKGSLLYNKKLNDLNLSDKYMAITEGSKIKFCYLKMPNPLKDKVISTPSSLPIEFNLHDYIDYETQFNKAFVSPLEDIAEVIGWQTKAPNFTPLNKFFEE